MAAAPVINPIFPICDTPCHPLFSFVSADPFFGKELAGGHSPPLPLPDFIQAEEKAPKRE
jgi:hypothetical protein